MNKKYMYIIIGCILIILVTYLVVRIINLNFDEENIIYEINQSDFSAPSTTYNVKINNEYNMQLEIKKGNSTIDGESSKEIKYRILSKKDKDVLKNILNNLKEKEQGNIRDYIVIDKVNNKQYIIEQGTGEYSQLYAIINNE